MKLRELFLNNFGKFTDQKIQLSEGINVLYGENESGKSTVHTFIRSMLFGMERGRGRASSNDTFSQYEPWENPNYYAGVLKFESGGKEFTIRRNFDKVQRSASLVCESDGETLSLEDGDLQELLGGMTQNLYANTVSIGQLQIEPGQQLADALKNYAANYYACGDGDLDLTAACNKLKERQKEIDKETDRVLRERQDKQDRLKQESQYVWQDMHRLQEELENLDDEIDRRKEMEAEEQPENTGAIDEIRPKKWRIHPLEIIGLVLLDVLSYVLLPRPWRYPVAVVVFLLGGIYVWNRMKVGKKQEKTEPEKILEEITPEEEKAPLEKLYWQQERAQEELKEKEVQYDNLKEQMAELDELDENFQEREHEQEAVKMAQQRLQELSIQMQNQMKRRINGRVSEIVQELTGGKYSRLQVEDDFSLNLWVEDRKIPLHRLSRGTIEQVYFALRMASSEFMQEEDCPVILDDTFAYYDDERLDHTLMWLQKHKKQVLLFTCQKREKEALDRLQIPYQLTLL